MSLRSTPTVTGPSTDDPIQTGRELEEARKFDEAAEAYLQGGAHREAARLLSFSGRFSEAAEALLQGLPPEPTPPSHLSTEERRDALNAALCFARGGARIECIALLIHLGEAERAAALLTNTGRRKEAVEAMKGKVPVGSPWPDGLLFRTTKFLTLPRSAVITLSPEDLEALPDEPNHDSSDFDPLTAEPEDSRYGAALAEVIRGVWGQQRLSRRVVLFLDEFVRRASIDGLPNGLRPTAYAVGRLFEFHDRPDAAKKLYGSIATADSSFADASYRLGNLESGLAEADDGCWYPLQLMIGGRHPFSDLPRLSDLPDLAGDTGVPDGSFKAASPSSARRRDEPTRDNDSLFTTTDSLRKLRVGSVIADRYRIEESVGTGGMATVYRATDLQLEETIALKLFRSAGQTKRGLARFRREMKLSRKLKHTNIVDTYEFGTWRGLHFITMELLEGKDLAALASERPDGRIPADELIPLIIQAANGLEVAHAEGIVHRDVKPQNLFVLRDGTLKVMDFGIAKGHSSATISVTGVLLGTPRYMSPEQIESGKTVGPMADLYSLGVVMYEGLTGIPPFTGDTLVRLLLSHMSEQPRPPRVIAAEIPEPVERIVLRLMAKDPGDRYLDCADLREALEACLEQDSVSP